MEVASLGWSVPLLAVAIRPAYAFLVKGTGARSVAGYTAVLPFSGERCLVG